MTDQTMMERLFGALERMDQPTMIETLFGSMAAMSIKQRREAIDAMVKAAPPKSNVQKTMCGTAFRYRVHILDTLAAFENRNLRGTFDSAASVDEFDTIYGRLK
ncbi:hypothetical protein AB3X96_18075 [Paraburkholderia sp. BR13439]|uniref:hypothetical protein n=1 Tax=Paraburkholderia sp. BR13439 TaxID=3236996 RepID=UPI0034CFBFAE